MLQNILFQIHDEFSIHQRTLKKKSERFSTLIIIHVFFAFFFFEHQINMLQLFLKDHVALKTGVMMLKNQLCH